MIYSAHANALRFAPWLALLSAMAPSVQAQDEIDFFEARIRPVLVEHCYECHSSGAAEIQGGLVLDYRDGLRAGGDSGPALVPGEPAASLLLDALRHESFEMPPTGKLPDAVIADFARWIERGAPDPRDAPPSPIEAAEAAWKIKLAQRSRWWSLQPPRDSQLPSVSDSAWAREPVDRFILAGLESAALTPAPPAQAETLIRRLSFVLTGLPPRPDQVEAFRAAYQNDPDAAVEALVDQLLASPHYGERFARHWMDVVRYTDTYGYEWDNPAKGSWEYRDYLIRAFNADVGFDQLIREQLAGDLLPEPRVNPESGVIESLIGPMFYHMGEHRHGTSLDFNGIHQEMIDNKIDAFSKAFLGMTVACARCHDHKLDAISQADYYALAGVFMTPRWTTRAIDASEKHAAQISELLRLRDEIRAELGRAWTTHAREGLDPQTLREWAAKRRANWQTAGNEEIAYPLARLLEQTSWLETDSLRSETQQRALDQAMVNRWNELASEWATERETRQQANQAQFTVLTDFSQPGFPDGWVTDGAGLEHGYVTDGTPRIALEGETLIDTLLPRGYHTHALSSKLPGAIRLPPPESFPRKIVSLRLSGSDWAGRIDVPQNAFQAENIAFLDPNAPPTWLTVSGRGLNNGVTRVLTEFATSDLHPNFPPRTGLARAGSTRLPDDDDGFDKRSWFSLTGIMAHDTPGTPADTLDAFEPLYSGAAPETGDEVWQRLAGWLSSTVERWALGEARAEDVRVLNWLLTEDLLPNRTEKSPKVAELVEQYRRVEAEIEFARSANSMDERDIAPVNYRLNIRGNVDDEGPEIPRGFLEIFSHELSTNSPSLGELSSSGRLELAYYLADHRNPQTPRVYVNRVWQWIFSTGIVATPSDHGHLGDLPSHPELLDWLTLRFMEEGWSTKQLVKRLVLSRTFRQSGESEPGARQHDPDNRLLHHYPTRRLEAEAIRDNLLAVSGRLDPRLFGRPINPPRVAQDSAKRLFSGPWDSHGRRSIYITMSIMEPPKFLVGFNLPDLKLPTGRRDETNVPAQALLMLNDPLVTQLAEHWAEQLVGDGRTDPGERLASMFLAALGREATSDERQRWVEAARQLAESEGGWMADRQVWADVAHALFNTKEFIYYR